jgi:MFS family permease
MAAMSDSPYTAYGYRWLVLAVFMLTNLAIQMLWISYAPITGPAASFYGVTDLQIGLLSMTFMIVFIPLSIPVAFLIDKYGFRLAVSIGAILMALSAILRGLSGANYKSVLACTVGLAIAQPFMMNSWTKLPANWFPIQERATAVGLVVLSNLLGTAVGLGATPALAERMNIPSVQLIYGGVAAASALLFVLFAREHPPTPPGSDTAQARALMVDGLKHALTVKPFWIYLLVWFIGMGVFNGTSTWIEGILRPRGFTPEQAGQTGAVMLIGGVVGALLIPALSDRQQKRQRYILLGVLLAIPGLAGLAFATSYGLLLGCTFMLGFFLVSTGPIGMQYAAEITHPTPEGTSAGLIQLCGQASVVFVYLMDATRNNDGSFTRSLLLAIGLMAVAAVAVTRLKDSFATRPGVQA